MLSGIKGTHVSVTGKVPKSWATARYAGNVLCRAPKDEVEVKSISINQLWENLGTTCSLMKS